jgi:hypothetical protein
LSRKLLLSRKTAHNADAASSLALDGWMPPPHDGYFQIRISRNTLLAILVSLLLHALLLFTIPKFDFLQTPPDRAQQQSITVRLNTVKQPEPAPQPAIPEPAPEPPKPKPKPKPPAPKPVPKPAPKPKEPEVMAVEKPAPEKAAPDSFTIPAAPPPPPAPPTETESAAPAAPTDMMSYVNAARARRQSAQQEAVHQNAEAVARERGPTAEEQRDAIIKRNLQAQGTNGVFQILSMDSRSASFSFRGWTDDYSSARRQVIRVEVGPGEDLNRAIVRKMIGLIRQYYKGDFNWDSYRLNRVVILSARLEDSAGLEDFMLEEFFGSQGIAVPR